MNKPIVYIASPYTKGDVSINVHFQCKIFDELMDDGIVFPVVPLWSHFQHTIFPRQYKDWIAYDLALLCRYDACLRLDAVNEKLNYHQHDSSGADGEVEEFKRLGKPVFFSKSELYEWVKAPTQEEDNAPTEEEDWLGDRLFRKYLSGHLHGPVEPTSGKRIRSKKLKIKAPAQLVNPPTTKKATIE